MNSKSLSFLLFAALLLTACGASPTPAEPTPDIAAVRTSAASTVEARFTLTAAAFTPTPPPPTPTDTATPEPEATATSTATSPVIAVITDAQGTAIPLCDSLTFVADVTVPDNTTMSPGQEFTKTWRVKNTGTCPWGAGYVLAYAGYSTQMSGQFIPLTEVVQPGEEVEVSVQFKAPTQVGEYLSAWAMKNPQGRTFPEIIYVKIIVQ
ncbi:MAG: NBR1-Ig-like domain-containing protein [Chloroflexota bacterium]